MKTRVKGNRAVRKCINYLKTKGYIVSKAEVGGKFVKQKDMFGLFDLVAIRKGNILLVQVTCNRNHPHKKFQEFSNMYANESIYIEQYIWMDYKGFVQYIYYPNNYKTKLVLY